MPLFMKPQKPPTRPRKRWRVIVGCGLAFCMVLWFGAGEFFLAPQPILVGVLHSQTGPIAVSEQAMIDAERLAFEEINAAGGLLGRPIKWIVADGASDWPTFAREADRLIYEEDVTVLFGCWTSASRKSVLPVLERSDHLLIYPMAYEGLESCPNVIYTGAAPNQQITPAVQWCQSALGARRFFLLGSDYIWPHCVNAIISDQLMGLGVEKVDEKYVPFGSTDLKPYVQEIIDSQPDVILCSVVGDSAIALFRELREAGISPDDIPVITFAIAEDELRSTNHANMVGHYAAWNYFQSIDSEENRRFVSAFKTRYGADRVTSDVIAAAYNSVYLWANAVRESGNTDVQQVRNALRQQSLNAPEGIIAVDPSTQHTWRPVYIGRINENAQFDIVWSSNGSVRPVPYPITRSKTSWENFVSELHRRWGGWANTGTTQPEETPGND